MSLKSGIQAATARSPTRKSGPGITRTLTLDSPVGWVEGMESGEDERNALKLSTVKRCVDVLADSIAEIPVSVRNWKTNEEITQHYLSKVLCQRPNEAMTPFVYKRLLERNRNLRGNAYAYINRDAHGRPVELIPLSPDYVSVNLDLSGHLWYGYTHPTSGKQYAIESINVEHYKNDSEDGLIGISTLRHAALALKTARAREEYDHAMYVNGGRPAGVLQTDSDITSSYRSEADAGGAEQRVYYRDIVRNEWERVHSGAANAFRVAVLDNGLKYQPISVTNSDAQFVENKETSVIDICRFFGVPPHKAFAGNQSYDANEANSIGFVTDTIQPIVTQYEEEDKWKLLVPDDVNAGLVIYRNMLSSLRGNTDARGKWYMTMRNIGAYSVNDILRKENERGVPGGDERYASLNNIPLDLFRSLSIARNTKGAENADGNQGSAD